MANRRDVELVVKARDEATKVASKITDALMILSGTQGDLASSGGKLGASLLELKGALGQVEKAYESIDSDANRALSSFERQRGKLTESKDAYAALTSQIEAAKAALARLRSEPGISDKIQGPMRPGADRQLKAVEMAYRGLNSEASKLASSISRQEAAVEQAQSALQELGSTANAVEAALEGVGSAEHRRNIIAQADAFEEAQRQAAQYRAEISRLRGEEAARRNDTGLTANHAGPGFAANLRMQMEEAAEAEAEMAAAAARLRNELNPVAAIQEQLNRELDEARVLYGAGKIEANELAAAEANLAAKAKRAAEAINGQNRTGASGKPTFLGLKPYELQNLGYQINDVFTQIASGTSVTQTLAQQGGQVIQLFPKMMAAIGAGARDPKVMATIAVLGTMALAIRRITALSNDVRYFSGQLAFMSDGARYSATNLALVARGLDETGFKAKDARQAVAAFLKEGLDPTQIEAFALAVRNYAKISGEDLPGAAKKIAAAFKGGYESVARLDDELNFLQPSERAYIKTLFDSGRALEARSYAFDKFNKQAQEAADLSKGPWSDAIKDLTEAWRGFLDWVGRTGIIQETIKEIKALAEGAKWLTSQLPGARNVAAAGNGGLPGGVQRRPDWEGRALGSSVSWTKPKWAGGDGGTVVVTADIAAIVRTVMLEARNSPQAQQDVAAVILNRMAQSGMTGQQVVTAKGQFQPVGDPGTETRRQWESIAIDSQRFREVLTNILPILEGVVADPTKGATLFYSPEGQKANVRNGLSRDLTPAWAKPENLTVERDGHRFYKGGFPMTPGGEAAAGYDKQARKVGQDLINTAAERYALEQKASDEMRVQIAGQNALRQAQETGADEEAQQLLASMAMHNELFRITTERTAQQKELTSAVASYGSKAAEAEGRWSENLAHMVEERDALLKQVDELERRGLKTDSFGTPLEQIRDQINATHELIVQQERMKDWEEQIAALQQTRSDKLAEINTRYQMGAISLTEAQRQMADVNADLVPKMQNVADFAVQFAESLRTATPNPALESFITRLKALPNDLKAATDKAQIDMANTAATVLSAQRNSLMQQLEIARQEGDGDQIRLLEGQLTSVNQKLIEALTNVRALWLALGSGPEAQAAVAQIDATIAGLQNFSATFRVSAGEINQMIVSGAVNGFNEMAQAIDEGVDAISALETAFRNFAAEFLMQIANMILQQMILNMLQAASGGGGVGGMIANGLNSLTGGKLIPAGKKHSGGLAGTGVKYNVPAAWFENAIRYHGGGIAGLAPDEVPTILKRNEEVLTEDDPRHRANGGGKAGTNLRVINTLDPGEFVSKGLDTADGEQAVLNFISANSSEIKQRLGG